MISLCLTLCRFFQFLFLWLKPKHYFGSISKARLFHSEALEYIFANFPKIHYRICRPLHATPISPIWTSQLWTSYISVGNMNFWMQTFSTNPAVLWHPNQESCSQWTSTCNLLNNLVTWHASGLENKLVLKCWNSSNIAIIIPARYTYIYIYT